VSQLSTHEVEQYLRGELALVVVPVDHLLRVLLSAPMAALLIQAAGGALDKRGLPAEVVHQAARAEAVDILRQLLGLPPAVSSPVHDHVEDHVEVAR